MSRKLEGDARDEALDALGKAGWSVLEDRDAIRKTFKFKSFVDAWGWMCNGLHPMISPDCIP